MTLNRRSAALLELGHRLKKLAYSFVTITPESHRRVLSARRTSLAGDLRDVFGWNLPFHKRSIAPDIWRLMEEADVLKSDGAAYKSCVRYSSIGADLFVHSGYPTVERNAVFFGPDTYRFCRLLCDRAPRAKTLVDMGCGSGAGGIALRDRAETLILTDVNPLALEFATVNAHLAGLKTVMVRQSDCLANVDESANLIIANPPYVVDPERRTYRDGGGPHGVALACRMLRESLAKLAPQGTLILYTGTPIIQGRDMFWESIQDHVRGLGHFTYEELEVDVFGEELGSAAYPNAERLAVVHLTITKEQGHFS